MKERIKAYLKQHHCRDYFNSYGETVEDDHYFMYQEDVDGLIELIVRECIKTIEYRAPGQMGEVGKGWTNGYDDGLKTGAWLLKEHFGLEE